MKVTTSSGLEIEIRSVVPSDEGQIVELFNNVFDQRRFAPFSEEEWRWKYLKNPVARLDLSFVALDKAGKIIAHIGNWPFKIHSLGKQELSSHWLDSFMMPEYQKHGIIMSLFKPYFEAQKNAGIKSSFSFPNEKSIHALRSTSKFMFLMDQREMLIGGDGHQAMAKWFESLDHENRYGFDLKPDCELNSSIDEMLADCRKSELLSLWKDTAWYKWKYLESPRGNSYRFFSLDAFGICGGFAVVRESGRTADILEIHGMKKDVSYAKEMVIQLAEYYKELNGPVDRLAFIGKDHWFFDGVFENFEKKRSFFYYFMARATNPEDAHIYENSANWTITHSDADEV